MKVLIICFVLICLCSVFEISSCSYNNIEAFERMALKKLVSSCTSSEEVKLVNAATVAAIQYCFSEDKMDSSEEEEDDDSEEDSHFLERNMIDLVFPELRFFKSKNKNKDRDNGKKEDTKKEVNELLKQSVEEEDENMSSDVSMMKKISEMIVEMMNKKKEDDFFNEDENSEINRETNEEVLRKLRMFERIFQMKNRDRDVRDANFNMEDFFKFEDLDFNDESDDEFNTFFNRNKRSLMFLPDQTSFTDMIKREVYLRDKFMKFRCVLQRRLEIVDTEEYREEFKKLEEPNEDLIDEITDSKEDCLQYANCLDEIYENSSIYPLTLRKIIELIKCNQRQLRFLCIKNDMRLLLSEQAVENGTLAEIYEMLIDKVVQISTFHDVFDTIDALMTM